MNSLFKKIWAVIKKGFDRYLVKAMSNMALGLFSSLIIGLIISQVARIPHLEFLASIADIAKSGAVVGGAIGGAVAFGLGAKPLVVFSSIVAGAVGYVYGDAGPVGAYLASVVGCEIGSLVSGKTKIDIIVSPFVTIVSGGIIGILTGPFVSSIMNGLGDFINVATELSPFPMGIIVSVVVGMALTAPISSAALCIMLGLDGIAAGAAVVGCSAQMIGFAVGSFKENGWGGLLSQGIGTSMLQFGNILKKPVIWLPTIISSAILGPISTCVFKMTNIPAGAGMGTSGFVGQFGAFTAMSGQNSLFVWGTVILMHFILPAILGYVLTLIFRKFGLIKDGDMKISI